jgi:hypothetical protein
MHASKHFKVSINICALSSIKIIIWDKKQKK